MDVMFLFTDHVIYLFTDLFQKLYRYLVRVSDPAILNSIRHWVRGCGVLSGSWLALELRPLHCACKRRPCGCSRLLHRRSESPSNDPSDPVWTRPTCN